MRHDLIALAEKCETATGPDRRLDAQIALLCVPEYAGWIVHPANHDNQWGELAPSIEAFDEWLIRNGKPCLIASPRYTGSIDAAMTLVPEGYWAAFDPHFMDEDGVVLYRGYTFRPNWPKWSTFRDWIGRSDDHPLCASPALAITAACLRARAQGDAE